VPKENEYSGSAATQYFRRRSGQFIYGKLDFLHGAFGIVPKSLDGYESTLDSPAFDVNSDLNTMFLLLYVSRKTFYLQLGMIANGSRKAKRIHAKTLFAMPIQLPSLVEQKCIASVFSKIDKIITLHQRKLELLKKLKQGYLQKLFPQDGQKVPQLRFAQFDENLNKCTLGDIFDERKDRSSKGRLLSVTISDGIIPFSSLNRKNNSSKDKTNYKLVLEGDVAYNSMRMWQGASGVATVNGIVSPAYTVLKPKIKIFVDYFGFLFKTRSMIQRFQASSQGLTSDTWNLKYPQLKVLQVYIPVEKEQIKIAQFMIVLNQHIVFEEEQIENLEVLKRAYLQNLFI
jgi:type I restriction enzyme S subunit